VTSNDLENMAIGLLSSMTERTPATVRTVLRQLLPLTGELAERLTSNDLEEIARHIETRLYIKMEDAAAIQTAFTEWLPQRRTDTPGYFYPRYRTYLGTRGFPPAVLGVLDKDTDKIVGLFQDPKRQGAWQRRGLVVGHVQSGKTANYTGVICKAADYGYRFIVVLTGIQEDLRVQTQVRIEEGFIGSSSEGTSSQDTQIGVGLQGMEHRPTTLTSRMDDFRTTQTALTVPIQSMGEPLILVMKKNKKILENLIAWLRTKSHEGGGRIAGVPMLLIDDEADNASINVAGEGSGPSTINSLIRKLLDVFERNVYVGYTATPFANIFIDPESTDDWQREDLFPRDFIVSLDAPTNYVGPSRVFAPEGDLHFSLVEVADHVGLLPERHKITLDPPRLPDSLEEAVRVFILARALRIHRGQGTDHSSMLVNVSRFNDVQTRITGLISNVMNSIRASCQGHAMLPEAQALQDAGMRALRVAWDARFEGHVAESWGDVQSLLGSAAGPVEVRKINSKSPDALDYRRYKETGLHVIAVGGFVLSRGFTLEGLTVSYFLRNSMMYDTLLQMGRWFGYRDGYDDVCRIYMTEDAIDWYAHISEAVDELREEFKRMERARRTPADFGLRVRSHPESLIVTARNKMRSGKSVLHSIALAGKLIETAELRVSDVEHNRLELANFVKRLQRRQRITPATDSEYLWSEVPAEYVCDFIESFRNHDDASISTQSGPTCDYIRSLAAGGVEAWDVCLYSLKQDGGPEFTIHDLPVRLQERKVSSRLEEGGGRYIKVSGNSKRVASRGHEKVGMSSAERKEAEDNFRSTPGNEKKSVPDHAYRIKRSRPLLMLHALYPKVQEESEGCGDLSPFVGAWGASFPDINADVQTVKYVVNTTWWAENYAADIEEQESDESE